MLCKYGKRKLQLADNQLTAISLCCLGRIVTKYSGKFKARLNLLANGRLKKKDYHLILLIRCGMTPTNMTVLLGRTKGTISYRREEIGLKLMDENLSVKDVDDIIRGL